ncbi:hypothetical protein [Alkalihalobacillus trypoxylicola]|uniref:Uncharacterized protein n=1 Tax=Alkalihalobacillus trypoxylicola TaxID=519424 RepID=A0A161PA92_9BACI|nr:hypothetical protein [Alkalihalobacillus trypoxylicola]KYG28141.1 hypothetical protein AZF04_09565 [Alkalihalobacillus trypoxylicola]
MLNIRHQGKVYEVVGFETVISDRIRVETCYAIHGSSILQEGYVYYKKDDILIHLRDVINATSDTLKLILSKRGIKV